MAQRTGAVAGINGDYFDIGNTNRPTNIVVRNGVLLQMPRNRYALAITRDGTPHIAEFAFMGQVQVGDRTASLDARRPAAARRRHVAVDAGVRQRSAARKRHARRRCNRSTARRRSRAIA